MAKYSYEFKNKVVHEYLQGVNSYRTLAKKYNISDAICIRNWVAASETFGEEGLQRSRQNKTYSFQFKLHAVQLYLESELSYKKLAMSLGIKEPSILVNWVSRYRAIGIDGLKPQRKGRRPAVPKPSLPKETSDNQQEYLKQLEEENLRLRIEVAFLKEARRLRLAQEAQRQQQGLSTVSEDLTD